MFGCVGALGTTFIVIPSVAWLSKTFGKKKAFMLSQSISLVGYIMLYFLFVPGKPWMYMIALPFFSFGIGSLFTIMMSMTSDVLDIDELNTGKREGVFGAIYWWMVKLGFAFAGALSGLILTLVNYQNGAALQPEGSENLRLVFSGLPIVCTLIAIAVMWNYKVDENYAKEVRAELDKKKTDTRLVFLLRGLPFMFAYEFKE